MSVINLYFLLRRKNEMTEQELLELDRLQKKAQLCLTVTDKNGTRQTPQFVWVDRATNSTNPTTFTLRGISYHDIHHGIRDSFQASSGSTTDVNYQRVHIYNIHPRRY